MSLQHLALTSAPPALRGWSELDSRRAAAQSFVVPVPAAHLTPENEDSAETQPRRADCGPDSSTITCGECGSKEPSRAADAKGFLICPWCGGTELLDGASRGWWCLDCERLAWHYVPTGLVRADCVDNGKEPLPAPGVANAARARDTLGAQ